MQIINTEYTLIGCVEGCKHRFPDTTETEVRQPERAESYTAIITTPHCARISECGERRTKIYEHAEQRKNEIYLTLTSKGVSWKSAWRRAHKAWDVVSSEYRDKPCPFFEK